MTDYMERPLSQVTLGDRVTVWTLTDDGHRSHGQGGVITALEPQLVVSVTGVADHPFDRARFGADLVLEVELPTDPRACVDYGPDCDGEVEYFDPSGRGRGAQRCAEHRDQRAERYQAGIERYAHSDVAPDWFDPAYAGERWTDD